MSVCVLACSLFFLALSLWQFFLFETHLHGSREVSHSQMSVTPLFWCFLPRPKSSSLGPPNLSSSLGSSLLGSSSFPCLLLPGSGSSPLPLLGRAFRIPSPVLAGLMVHWEELQNRLLGIQEAGPRQGTEKFRLAVRRFLWDL